MSRAIQCAQCGYEGPAETVVEGLVVCPDCGEHVGEAPRQSPLYRTRFHYRARALGPLSRVVEKVRPAPIRDEADRPIAHVRHRRSPQRLLAQLAGAGLFTAAIVALMWIAARLPDSTVLLHLMMYVGVFGALVASLALVTMLSPGPDALVVAVGHDPRLLLRLRPVGHSLSTSTLRVEDGDGVSLGLLRLHRLRAYLLLNPGRGPVLEIEPTRGQRVLARRPGPGRGWTFEIDSGVVGAFALEGGFLGRDTLQIEDPPPVDPRLFVAAIIAGRE